MKQTLRVLLILGILACYLSALVPVQAAELTQYEHYSTGGDGDSDAIYAGNMSAMQFTSDATAHKAMSVLVSLKRVGTPGTVRMSIRNASAGVVTGIDLGYCEFNGNYLATGYSFYTAEFTTPVSLAASTQYSIVISAASGDSSNYVVWQQDSGGGLANAVGNKSTDGGITWTSTTPEDYLFEIWGTLIRYTAQPDSAPTVTEIHANKSTYQEDDVVIYGYYNLPYETIPIVPANENYAFYIYDSGLTTCYGVADFYVYHDRGYNHGVISWYFPDGILTWGTEYKIKIEQIAGQFSTINSWTATIETTDYSLQTTHDGNQSEMTANVANLARKLEIEYDIKFITESDESFTLTDEGETYFRNAIPGIRVMAPALILIKSQEVDYDNTDYGMSQFDAYANRFDGNWVGDAMDVGGDLFGWTGSTFMSLLVTLPLCIAALIFSAIKFRGKIEPGLIVSCLFIIMSAIMGWFPAALFAAIFQLLVIYIGYQVFYQRSGDELGHRLMSFSVFCYFASMLICVIMDGTYFGSSEKSIFNSMSLFITYPLPIVGDIPVFNINFISTLGKILSWDYSFYTGSWEMLRWFWFAVLSVGPVWSLVKYFITIWPSIISIFRPNISV